MSRTGRLTTVLTLNLALVGGLIAVGLGAHSLGVFAEGADYLADAAGIAVALLALRFDRGTRTAGTATTLAALVNAGWLLVVNALIIAGATVRLLHGVRRVHGLPVLLVSAVAAAVMLVGAVILAGDAEDGDSAGAALTMRAVLLDTAADAAAAAGVATAGGVMFALQGDYWVDPVVATLIALVVGYHAARLLGTVLRRLAAGSSDRVPSCR